MREKENIQRLIELNPDYIGFIFYEKSQRFVGENFDPSITEMIPDTIQKVGVFVNSPADYVLSKVKKYGLGYVQLHGTEDVKYCSELKNSGVKIIKMFSVDENFDFSVIDVFSKYCEYPLFDTKTPLFGGSGKKFNWNILKKYTCHKPFFLSGGIAPDDIKKILQLTHSALHALDINSKFELYPGKKDINLIQPFIQKIRNSNNEI